jgi:hypothetical protein
MKKLHFSVEINADNEKVWKTLWQDETYRSGPAPLAKVLMLSAIGKKVARSSSFLPMGKACTAGLQKASLTSTFLQAHRRNEKRSKTTLTEETKAWSGSEENYTLSSDGKITKLNVDMDVVDEYEDYFSKTFPKAFEIVKEISEKN